MRGPALLAAVTLDGVPENLALGTSLATGVSLSMLVAIFFVSSVAIIDASRRLVE